MNNQNKPEDSMSVSARLSHRTFDYFEKPIQAKVYGDNIRRFVRTGPDSLIFFSLSYIFRIRQLWLR